MAAIRLVLVLWGAMLVMFSTYELRRSPAGSSRGRRGPVREGYKVIALILKPSLGPLWTCGPAPSPAATPRVCHRPPDCTRGSAHPGTLWC